MYGVRKPSSSGLSSASELNRPRRLNNSSRRYGWSSPMATAKAESRGSVLSRASEASIRKQFGIGRPNVQTVTIMASGVVFFTIVMLVRTAAIVPDHGHILPGSFGRRQRKIGVDQSVKSMNANNDIGNIKNNNRNMDKIKKADTNDNNGNNDVNNDNNDNNNNNFTGLIAADGSHFIADLSGTNFDIRYTGIQSRLGVDRMNRGISKKKARIARIAFFIQVSESNLRLLSRLLIVMWHPRNFYLIHFDRKIANETRQQFCRTVEKDELLSDNVHFLEPDVITYKGVSMLLNTLAAIEFLLDLSAEWDYFINLSGSDYPLVNTDTMSRILGEPAVLSQNKSFIQIATNKRFWHSMKQSRFDFIYYDNALSLLKNFKAELLLTWTHHPLFNEGAVGVEFVQSEAWIIAHRSFAKYAVHGNMARKLLLLLSMMQDPEEHFFAMLAWNSPQFNQSLAHHAFRAVFWELHGKMSGQHPYYIDDADKQGTYPLWDGHLTMSRCFFARKVKHPDSPILNRIDRFMSGTHPKADKQTVTANITAVRNFVHCIANVDPNSDQIRSTNFC